MLVYGNLKHKAYIFTRNILRIKHTDNTIDSATNLCPCLCNTPPLSYKKICLVLNLLTLSLKPIKVQINSYNFF